jgi:hypothetical protein
MAARGDAMRLRARRAAQTLEACFVAEQSLHWCLTSIPWLWLWRIEFLWRACCASVPRVTAQFLLPVRLLTSCVPFACSSCVPVHLSSPFTCSPFG